MQEAGGSMSAAHQDPAACTQLQEGDFLSICFRNWTSTWGFGWTKVSPVTERQVNTLHTHFFFTCRNPILNEQLILSLKHSISQPPELHQALGLKFWNAQTEQQALQFLEPIYTHWRSKTTHLHLSISNTKKHSVAYLNIMWPFSNL